MLLFLVRHKAWNSSWGDKNNSNQTPKDKVVCNSRIRSMDGALRTWTLIWCKSDCLTVIKAASDKTFSAAEDTHRYQVTICSSHCMTAVWGLFLWHALSQHPVRTARSFFLLLIYPSAYSEQRSASCGMLTAPVVLISSCVCWLNGSAACSKVVEHFRGTCVRIKVETGTLRIKTKTNK